MTEEIKGILEYLKNDNYSQVFADEGCDDTPYKLFEKSEIKLLLNYITNLQKENEQLRTELNGNKQRCENAIELVKSLIVFWKKYSPDNTMEIEQFKNVLNILQGDDYE